MRTPALETVTGTGHSPCAGAGKTARRWFAGRITLSMSLVLIGMLFWSSLAMAYEINPDWPQEKISPIVLKHQRLKKQPPNISLAAHKENLEQLGLNSSNLNGEECVIYVNNRLTLNDIAEFAFYGIHISEENYVPPVPGQHPYGFHLAFVEYVALPIVESDPRFVHMETAEFQHEAHNDLGGAMIRTDLVHAGTGVMARTGTGINIAVADTGIDPTHPDIPARVEQFDMTDGTGPGDWGASVTNTVSDHGQHVSGSAVGSGGLSGGQYVGSAPGANFYFYKIGNDTNGNASGTDEIEAINRALAVGCDVFSMSFGGLSAYLDGSGSVAQAVDAAHAGGMLCFISAGNAQDDNTHYSQNVLNGTTTGTFGFTIVNNTGAAFTGGVGLWVIWRDGSIDDNIALACTNLGGGESLNLDASGSSPRNTETRQYTLTPNLANGASKTYNLTLQNTAGAGNPRVHVYRSGGMGTFDNPDPTFTVASPAIADNAIAVAAWTSRANWTDFQGNGPWTYGETVGTLASFSSLGPRIDNVQKPDITAPGTAIISTRDRGNHIVTTNPLSGNPTLTIDDDGLNLDGSGPANYYIKQGTSMACPLAAGAMCLLLQADNTLTPNQARNIIFNTAQNPGGAPNNNVGNGILDIYAAICSLDNEAPELTCPDDITVECDRPAGLPANDAQLSGFFAAATATDNEDPNPSVTNDAPAIFPFGTTTVTFTAEDGCGNSAQCQADVTVEDTTPPEITCPDDITVECTSHGGTPMADAQLIPFFSGVSATDECDDAPQISHDAPAFFPLGTTTVTFTAKDHSNNMSSCQADVTVEDTTPPTIEVTLSREELWPPNHKMATVTATEVEVEDICDPNPTYVLTTILSDEPVNGNGDGNTKPDWEADFGTPDTEFQLRSERSGTGDGRKYSIIYTAMDMSGNTADDTACVFVPHDQSAEAVASLGFTSSGTALDPAAQYFVLIVESRAPQIESDGSGIKVQIAPGFDATQIDPARAYVGNLAGVISPYNSNQTDANRDGLMDLALRYSVAEFFEIVESDPWQGNYASREAAYGTPGLHFISGGGMNYLVPDIFNLGFPIAIDPPEGLEDPGDDGGRDIPNATVLTSIFPNPFNPTATIEFNLVNPEVVSLEVYSTRGNRVRTLIDRAMPAGLQSVVWNGVDDFGRNVSSGVYFFVLKAGEVTSTKKAVLLK